MKKLFTNDRFFAISVILSTLGMLLYAQRMFYRLFASANMMYLSYGFTHIAFPACLIALFVTYKKHNKNVMKAMIGALLMALVLDSFSYLQSPTPFDVTFAFAYIIIAVGLFINHMLINGTHHSSRKNVAVNQVLVFLLALAHVVWFVYTLSNFIGEAGTFFSFVCYVFGYVFMAFAIICVESRLDAYRLDREAAGWTEKKGYPEGYVHEHEKK